MMSVENIIELKGIKKRFEDNFEAVKDFNLQVKKGRVCDISGSFRMRKDHNIANDRRI